MGQKVKHTIRTIAAFLLLVSSASAATYRTANFVVTAASAQVARQVGDVAEKSRKDLAVAWVGREFGRWNKPCPITVRITRGSDSGWTSFAFDRGEVFGWKMSVSGQLATLLRSTVPHEVCHTIFATHFRHPLPRWADEGAATLAEAGPEQDHRWKVFWTERRRGGLIPFRSLLTATEYASGKKQVQYAQGYMLSAYLVRRGGRPNFLAFVKDAKSIGWDRAFQAYYQFRGAADAESQFMAWAAGSVAVSRPQASSGPFLATRHPNTRRSAKPIMWVFSRREP